MIGRQIRRLGFDSNCSFGLCRRSVAFARLRTGRAKALIRNQCRTCKRGYFAAILFLMMPALAARLRSNESGAARLHCLLACIERPAVFRLSFTPKKTSKT